MSACCLSCCSAGDMGDHTYCVGCSSNPDCSSNRDEHGSYAYTSDELARQQKPDEEIAVADQVTEETPVTEKTPVSTGNDTKEQAEPAVADEEKLAAQAAEAKK